MTMRLLLESSKIARDYRNSIDYSKICTFGIKCIDDILYGISPKDFITIGADSGAGKSEVCLKIAIHNARLGRKIGLYFIEGGDEEASERIKWNLMCEKYFGKKMTGINMDYRKWRIGLTKGDLIAKLEDECILENKDVFENIITYGYEKGMSIQDFISSLDYFLKPEQGWEEDTFSYKHQVNLIIIDHLQYFNLSNPARELVEQGEILKKVNEICHGYKIPVILVSHLRKKDKDRGLPSQEDFYGTSNIPKMSSLAITMSSQASKDGIHYPTFFRFVKSRTKIPSNYALLCNYNLKLSNYEDEYTCHRLKGDMPILEPLEKTVVPDCFSKANFKIKRTLSEQYSDESKQKEELSWEE